MTDEWSTAQCLLNSSSQPIFMSVWRWHVLPLKFANNVSNLCCRPSQVVLFRLLLCACLTLLASARLDLLCKVHVVYEYVHVNLSIGLLKTEHDFVGESCRWLVLHAIKQLAGISVCWQDYF
jgi:hypothetical protein